MNFLDTCIRHCTHCQLNVYYTEIKFQCVNKPAIHERIYISGRNVPLWRPMSTALLNVVTSRYFNKRERTSYNSLAPYVMCLRDEETIARPAAAVSCARFVVAINNSPGTNNSSSSERERQRATQSRFAYRQSRTAIARCRPRHVKIPPHFRDARDKEKTPRE